MASYSVNEVGRRRAEELIRHRQYVVKSEWGEAQPRAAQENSFLDSHSWDDYAAWHLGLTDGGSEETKGRYAFVFGDFRRVHRSGWSRDGCRATSSTSVGQCDCHASSSAVREVTVLGSLPSAS